MGMDDIHCHALIDELHYLLMRVTPPGSRLQAGEQNMLETGITNMPQRHTSVPRGQRPERVLICPPAWENIYSAFQHAKLGGIYTLQKY